MFWHITRIVEGSVLLCFLLLLAQPRVPSYPSATYACASPLRCDDVLTHSFFLSPPPSPHPRLLSQYCGDALLVIWRVELSTPKDEIAASYNRIVEASVQCGLDLLLQFKTRREETTKTKRAEGLTSGTFLTIVRARRRDLTCNQTLAPHTRCI